MSLDPGPQARRAWGATLQGARPYNQDGVLLGSFRLLGGREAQGLWQPASPAPVWTVFALSDGMGGPPGGEEARTFALTELDGLSRNWPADLRADRLRDDLLTLARALAAEGRRIDKPLMGCTLTGLAYGPGRVWGFHCGDSRAWFLHRGRLQALTADHSLCLKPGYSQAPKNILSSCLGGGTDEPEELDVFDWTARAAQPDSAFLLSSDGWHEFVQEAWDSGAAQAALAAPRPEAAGDFLAKRLEAALNQGSSDNLTLALIQNAPCGPDA